LDAASVERGRQLALAGAPTAGIPPCITCHGPKSLPIYPRLQGQHVPYMVGQLDLLKRGVNATSDLGLIMAPIAQRLSDQQIRDAAAYFASVTSSELSGAQPQ
jgi:cytochrome c553